MPCSAAWWGVFWAIFSNLPQPILAVPAYLFVETFRHLLPLGTGAAAGAMIFMVRRISTAGKKSRAPDSEMRASVGRCLRS